MPTKERPRDSNPDPTKSVDQSKYHPTQRDELLEGMQNEDPGTNYKEEPTTPIRHGAPKPAQDPTNP